MAFAGRAPDETASRDGVPPLALDAELSDAGEAQALSDAEALYREGETEAALAAFELILSREPDSVEAAVGSAMARWPAGTTARLRTLAIASEERAVVHFHLGFALFWEEREQAAVNAWRDALQAEPDSPAALRAENLLFPDMPRGRPIVVPSNELAPELRERPLAEQLSSMEAAARADLSAESALAYGVALQRAGRAISAREQFQLAAERDPDNPQARAAAAVALFEKSDPTPAFAALGQLSADFPDAAVVRYHLALMLIWLNDVDEARTQLSKALDVGGDGFYGSQAERLLARLDETGTAVPEPPDQE
ncbi:MAG: tetratricopeptide repeat protein [Gaiellaceae bacterium]